MENISRIQTEVKLPVESESGRITAGMVFASNLNRLLARRGKNPNQLAGFLELAPSTVYSWTAGKTSPQVGRLDEIGAFLGVPVDELFKRQGAEGSLDGDALRDLMEALADIDGAMARAKAARNRLARSAGLPVARDTIGGAAGQLLDDTRPSAAGPDAWGEE